MYKQRLHAPLPKLATAALLGVVALPVLGCDSSSEPPPPARVQARGNLAYACGLDCEYEGEGINNGLGCARNVRGVTRIFDGGGNEIARDDWNLDGGRRIRPRETFLYRGCCFSVAQVNSARSSTTEISWDDESC